MAVVGCGMVAAGASYPVNALLIAHIAIDRSFDLNSAVMEIAGDTIMPADVADIIANLTAKSLLVRDEAAGRDLYRLLTTTRAYALEKLTASG